MSSSSAVRVLGISFLFGVAACGNVSLATDAGGDGAAGSAMGGPAGDAGTSGGATPPVGTAGVGGGGAMGGSGGGVATGGSGGGVATGGSGGHAGVTGGGGQAGATGGSGGHAGAGGATGVCACTDIYQPVCGGDGKTYGNACDANCAGVTIAHTGACSDGGVSDTVTLQLTVPANKMFCEQSTGCNGAPSHFTILANGQALTISTPACPTICSSTCSPRACPLLCIAPHGSAVTGAELTWDGTIYAMSTCGQGTSCYAPSHAPAGKYVARMCATPGTLSGDGGFNATCTATGPAECVDVPFDYPGASPVVGHLP